MSPTTSDRPREITIVFYRHRPAYTRAVFRAIGIQIKSEEDIRLAGARMLVVKIEEQVLECSTLNV